MVAGPIVKSLATAQQQSMATVVWPRQFNFIGQILKVYDPH